MKNFYLVSFLHVIIDFTSCISNLTIAQESTPLNILFKFWKYRLWQKGETKYPRYMLWNKI